MTTKSYSEVDQYSITLVQELLQSNIEWTNVQDIVKLTFKGMMDVMKAQGYAIRELEKTKATKVEVSQKASIFDVTKTVAEVAANIESRATLEELQELLEMKASKADLQKVLNLKDNARIKVEFDDDIKTLKSRINKLQEDMNIIASKASEAHKEALNEKANRNEIIKKVAVLEKRTSTERLDNTLAERVNELEALINEHTLAVTTTNRHIQNLENKISTIHKNIELEIKQIHSSNKEVQKILSNEKSIEELKQCINNQIEANESEKKEELEILYGAIKNIKNDINKLREDTIKEQDNITKQENAKDELRKELITIRKEIDILARKVCDPKETQDFKLDIKKALKKKMGLREVKKALSEVKSEMAQRLVEIIEENRNVVNELKSCIYGELDRKANNSEIQLDLEKKAERSVVNSLLDQKANVADIEIVKNKLKVLQSEINNKGNLKELDAQTIYIKENIELLNKQLNLKANIKDVCALLDIKADAKDIDGEIQNLSKEITRRITPEELKVALSYQIRITESLGIGRWHWKSGNLINGYTIPWETQTVNTSPNNLLWEKSKTSVIAVMGGLYEVRLGLIGSKKGKAQVLVNSEVILVPSTKIDIKGKESMSLIEFISLPNKARVSVNLSSEFKAEGFIELRKL